MRLQELSMSSAGSSSTELTVSEEAGVRFVEGPPCRPLMRTAEDIGLVVEACFSARVTSALLYAPNLPKQFFDLSSGEAGAILQKLRNYRIRLAIVWTPNDAQLSDRFREMMAEEQRGNHFRLLESREAARAWLGRG
jgi:hypothetical protein